VLVPVRLCDGRVGDVRLLWVVLGVTVGLAGRRHGRLLVNELGLDGEVARDSLGGRHDGVVEREDIGGVMARSYSRVVGAQRMSSDRSPGSTQLRAPVAKEYHTQEEGSGGKAGAGEDEERETRQALADNIAISGGMGALSVESPTHCTLSE
jgi:hypothetical protein